MFEPKCPGLVEHASMINSRNSWHTCGNSFTLSLRKSVGVSMVVSISVFLSLLTVISFLITLMVIFFSLFALVNRDENYDARCYDCEYSHKVNGTICQYTTTQNNPKGYQANNIECCKLSLCHLIYNELSLCCQYIIRMIMQPTNILKNCLMPNSFVAKIWQKYWCGGVKWAMVCGGIKNVHGVVSVHGRCI